MERRDSSVNGTEKIKISPSGVPYSNAKRSGANRDGVAKAQPPNNKGRQTQTRQNVTKWNDAALRMLKPRRTKEVNVWRCRARQIFIFYCFFSEAVKIKMACVLRSGGRNDRPKQRHETKWTTGGRPLDCFACSSTALGCPYRKLNLHFNKN